MSGNKQSVRNTKVETTWGHLSVGGGGGVSGDSIKPPKFSDTLT